MFRFCEGNIHGSRPFTTLFLNNNSNIKIYIFIAQFNQFCHFKTKYDSCSVADVLLCRHSSQNIRNITWISIKVLEVESWTNLPECAGCDLAWELNRLPLYCEQATINIDGTVTVGQKSLATKTHLCEDLAKYIDDTADYALANLTRQLKTKKPINKYS